MSVGIFKTGPRAFRKVGTGEKVAFSFEDGRLLFKTLHPGNAGSSATSRRVHSRAIAMDSPHFSDFGLGNETEPEDEYVRDLLSGQYDVEGEVEASLWVMACIVKGELHVSRRSRNCFSKFSKKDQWPMLDEGMPCRLGRRSSLVETRDGVVAWGLGGNLGAVLLERDGENKWSVGERVEDIEGERAYGMMTDD